ncbi:MAG: ORF6N domain-containing protein [Bacilli bacterium]|nr:ORF6N domain-containing protein [Bacilli bacterium]
MKNNPRKFPERFSWILLDDELKFFSSRSKFSTLNKSNNKRGYNIKYLPRVFTEQGVAMLATILKSEKAVETSISIMDAFVKLRHYIKDNLLNQQI